MGIFQFKLPDIGEGMHEGEIVKWHVQVDDDIKEDQIMLEVQNDKAVVEIPSPVDGKVKELKVDEGTVSNVGDVLIEIEVEGDGNAEPDQQTEADVEQTAEVSKQEENVARGGAEDGTDHQSEPAAEPPSSATDKPAKPKFEAAEVLATPATRKLAREKGVILSDITATGKNGRITREDVENAASENPEKATTSHENTNMQEASEPKSVQSLADSNHTISTPIGERAEERVPFKGIRKAIANAMVKSKHTAPHVTLMDEVDVSKLIELRKRAKPLAESRGSKLTYLPFIVKALVAAAKKFPELNASIDDEQNELVYKSYYNVGIAVDTDQGLFVPVVQDANFKNIWQIADEIRELASKAQAGKLASSDMRGGTITITNIGSAGGMFFTPVINHPEVAILGTGRITEKPVVKSGEIVIGQMMALSLSFDHRMIDGATAQYALNQIKQLLEDPELFIMEV